jgi:MSHA biogenesis protein MshJ
MKQRLNTLLARLDALSLRERTMIFMATAVVLIALCHTLFWAPLQAKQKRLILQQKQIAGESISTQAEIDFKLKAHNDDPDGPNRLKVQQLEKQGRQLYERLRVQQKGLVPPDKVAHLLQTMLQQHPRLHLLRLTTIEDSAPAAAEPERTRSQTLENLISGDQAGKLTAAAALAVLAQSQAQSSAAAAAAAAEKTEKVAPKGPLFRHGVQLVLEGSYLDLLDYLTRMEQLPTQLYWGDMQLQVISYPRVELTLDVFTVSLDNKWLNL